MLSDKHGNIAQFAFFEQQHGIEAARDLLERMCEEDACPGSQYGIIVQEHIRHDPLNAMLKGLIEFKDVWYFFEVENGNANGTQLLQFDYDDETITERPAHLELSQQLLESLQQGVHPAELTAGYECVRLLRKRLPTGRVSSLTTQSHQILVILCGAIACQHQDYAEDALAYFKANAISHQTIGELYNKLSPSIKMALQQNTEKGPIEFLIQGLNPLLNSNVL